MRNLKLKKIIAIALAASIALAATACKKQNETEKKEDVVEIPTISLSYDGELASGSSEEFKVDVKLSSLPKGVYPCASLSVDFDKEKLEFTGIENGTIENYSQEIPIWQADVDNSNKTGKVNTIYLDESSGKNSYHNSGFAKESKDIILSLKFKLRDSVKSSDKITLKIADAEFATINGDVNDKDLSTSKETMKVKNLNLEIK